LGKHVSKDKIKKKRKKEPFLGGSVIYATNTVVGYFLGHATLYSFGSPENDNFFGEEIWKSTIKVREAKI